MGQVKGDYKVLGLSNWIDGFDINGNMEDHRTGTRLGDGA